MEQMGSVDGKELFLQEMGVDEKKNYRLSPEQIKEAQESSLRKLKEIQEAEITRNAMARKASSQIYITF